MIRAFRGFIPFNRHTPVPLTDEELEVEPGNPGIPLFDTKEGAMKEYRRIWEDFTRYKVRGTIRYLTWQGKFWVYFAA